MLRELLRMLLDYVTFPARCLARARNAASKANERTADQNRLIAEINYDLTHPGHPISSLPPDERERIIQADVAEAEKEG